MESRRESEVERKRTTKHRKRETRSKGKGTAGRGAQCTPTKKEAGSWSGR